MEKDGCGVALVDAKGGPYHSVEHRGAAYVLAKPGEAFQIAVTLDEKTRKQDVKARVLVDGQSVGYNAWINNGRAVIKGFKASRESRGQVYQFKFSDSHHEQAQQESMDDAKAAEENAADDKGSNASIGTIKVEFSRYIKPETAFCNYGCRMRPSAPKKDGKEIDRKEYNKDVQVKGDQWWEAPSLNTVAGELLEQGGGSPKKKPRRGGRGGRGGGRGGGWQRGGYDNWGPSNIHQAYNEDGWDDWSGYGGRNVPAALQRGGPWGMGPYGPGPMGGGPWGGPPFGGPRGPPGGGGGMGTCKHTQWRAANKLATITVYYQTPDCLVLRGILRPDSDNDHKLMLQEHGFYGDAEKEAALKIKAAKTPDVTMKGEKENAPGKTYQIKTHGY